MAVARVGNGSIDIAYDDLGEPGGVPLVLVMGIGAQRVMWDDAFCAMFVARGFRVIRFDHRDIGESTHLEAAVPRAGRTLARRILGLRVDAPYTLSDMANDVVGLLDALGIAKAHVAGVSMGGMVAQHLAIEHPDRVRSLTSIMSTAGRRRHLPETGALRALFRPLPRTAEEAGRAVIRTFSIIGSPAWPVDAARLQRVGEAAFRRGLNPRGFLRHFGAIHASGDRSKALARSKVPVLVIHGTRDPLIPIAAGREMTKLLSDVTWLPIAGMGHDLPTPMWPTFAAAIARHCARADAN